MTRRTSLSNEKKPAPFIAPYKFIPENTMKTLTKSITAEKENGRFYTPSFMVTNILDLVRYTGRGILKKHIIDNSCGNGAFLCEIVRRYCTEFLRVCSDRERLKAELEKYIHGIEIEPGEHLKCLNNMAAAAKDFGLDGVQWNVLCSDALSTDEFNGRMDFVVGNPPYIRVHNLGENFEAVKKLSLAQNGMTDMFIVFFEIGIKMMNKTGILGYITPSSYFTSIAGAQLRQNIMSRHLLKKILDLKHFQAFSATTYTAVTVLENGKSEDETEFFTYDSSLLTPVFCANLRKDDYFINGNFFFAKTNELSELRCILQNEKISDIAVKNGYATLCDSVFIGKFDFTSDYIIPAVKASKGTKTKIIFPYTKDLSLVPENELRRDRPLYDYLTKNKEKLLKRSNERDAEKFWYAFGRSQALADTFRDKLTVNAMLRDENDFKFIHAPAGTGVYGGLYITRGSVSFARIVSALKTEEFMAYIRLLGKYKSGGYYTFSSKDLKKYLDFKFEGDSNDNKQ